MKLASFIPKCTGGFSLASLFLAAWMALAGVSAHAQAPAASGGGAAPIPAAELDKLVAPIALYPDDLIGIILPAATFPVQIVQADRFLEKRKSDKNLKVNEEWHETVKSLLNYPDVVKKMSADLDWTTDLGEAVVADQAGVLEAIQRFRRKTQSVGNLKTDEKQTIVVEKEVIKIVPSNPEVIYVPQYNPTTVVVSGGYSAWGYYPSPYPVYYYPYAPGAAFATGLIWGAAITAAWNGGRYATHYGGGNNTININRNTNINTGNRVNAQSTAWRSEKKPGQVSSTTGRTAGSARVGDAQANRGGGGAAARPATSDAGRGQAGGGQRGGDAFGSYGAGHEARADSARGASSRDSMSANRGGGGRAGGGGGGRRGR